MPEVRNPLWNFEAFNFRSRIWFERKPLARNLKGVFPRNIQFYACIIQLSLCIQPDLCNIEVRLVQYTYMFNGTCSKCAQLIEILRSASETQRKRSFRRKGSLGITSLPFTEMILHHIYLHLPTSTLYAERASILLSTSVYWYIPTGSTYIYLHLPTYIYLHLSPSTDISLHLPTPAYIYLHLPTSTYIYLHLPTSTYIYLHLPTSTYIYRHLPTSTYIYLHLPTYTYIYLPTYRGHSQPMVRILGWRLALWNIEFTHLRNSRCWQRKMEPLCVGCPQWRCSLGSIRGHHGLSNKDVSIPTECSSTFK